ncbi:MAG: C40 family peptidase [Clostridiales bacterium]|nr:C40 family peptidase [Clostridiales bacterium]
MLTKRLFGIVMTAAMVISGLPLMSSAATSDAAGGITLSGTCHVQDYGDTEGKWDETTGILTLGTRGQSKRVEAITINFENNTGYGGTLQYRVHVQDIGWQDYRTAGEMAGTSGQSKRLEGIEMELTGDLAAYYTVEYAVHIQDYGDAQGFVSDGALAGTTGESKRLEEVQIRIVPRGTGNSTSVNYRVHRQDFGWESTWAKDGSESGTTGQSKRLEGIEIHLTGNQYSGSIEYHTHVQNIGWETDWAKDGEMSGTQGLSYRLEGIEIKLTGEVANYYDIYYRVHAQDFGWLGWAKNGEMSGTSGLSKRLEAIQIVLVAKGQTPPDTLCGITPNRPDDASLTAADFPPGLITEGNPFAQWCLDTFPADPNAPGAEGNTFYIASYSWPYKYAGSSPAGCDCSGFVVYVMREYFGKSVYHGMHKLAFSTGTVISYSELQPGDWLCDSTYYHGYVYFYVGKDNYGQDIILVGSTDGENTVVPTLKSFDIQAWLEEPGHDLKRV